jgi:hypothetical protein
MTPFQAAGTWVAQVPSVTLLSGAFGAPAALSASTASCTASASETETLMISRMALPART